VPPYLTFAVADTQFVITFAVMLVVALIISTLAARLRRQIRSARARERRLEALYRLSRELSAASGIHQLAAMAQREVSATFETDVVIYLPDGEGRLEPVVSTARSMKQDSQEHAVATWAFDHGRLAGNGTDTLPQATALHVPMVTPRGIAGILSVYQPKTEPLLTREPAARDDHTQIGIAIEQRPSRRDMGGPPSDRERA
jgi:two-component system sensor histidine kinase KdpD